MLRAYLLTLIIFLLSFRVDSQKVYPVQIYLCAQKKKWNECSDLIVKLSIKATYPNIKVPFRTCTIYGYDLNTLNIYEPDAVFEVEQIEGKKYSGISARSDISRDDSGLCFDSTGNEQFDTVEFKKPLQRAKNICNYYNFKKGKYRLRIKFNILSSSGLKPKSMYTNWVYFNILNEKRL